MDQENARRSRLIKSIFPIDLIDRVDSLVSRGIGGYKDRNEFIVEATRNHALELDFLDKGGDVDGESDSTFLAAASQSKPHSKSAGRPIRRGTYGIGGTSKPEADLADTLIAWPRNAPTLGSDDALPTVDEPLLGLHNRDYPSLWATAQIGEITSAGPISWDACAEEVLRRAWAFGEVLRSLDAPGERRSALFPTNEEKRSSSEAAFKSFGLGRISRTGTIVGPIFQWKLCGLFSRAGREPTIALLDTAPELFDRLEGLSADTPHKPAHANAFLEHIRRNNPADFDMITFVLDAVANSPTRQSLVEDVSIAMTSTSHASADTAATYASGYIARAREWGLVEPKLIDGTYRLTAFGEDTQNRYKKLELK